MPHAKAAAAMALMQDQLHDTCLLCGRKNPVGLKLEFRTQPDGSLKAEFQCKFLFEGYKGFLHGGVIASLLDSAMTNCLFSHGIAAFTAELDIKYKAPVRCGRKVSVTARIIKSYSPLHMLEASVEQDGQEAVLASAKFMESELLNK